MNRVSLKFGVIATVVAICALVFSAAGAGTAAAQSPGKNGVIYACYKAKGKNKGALRVVSQPNGCKRLRGWRPVSWSASGSPGGSGQAGSQGGHSEPGPKGDAGPEGKQGTEGPAGQVEKSLTETIQSQTIQINSLTKEVTDLTGELLDLENGLTTLGGDVLDLEGGLTGLEGGLTGLTGDVVDLEGTVEGACDQLSVLTDQSDELLSAIGGLSLNNTLQILGGLLEIPTLPAALGTFECT